MSQAKVFGPMIGVLLLLAVASFGRGILAETVQASTDQALLLERSVLSSGGSAGAAPPWIISGTLGQSTSSGEGLAGDRILRTGFWAWPPGITSGLTVLSAEPLRDYLFQNFPNPFRSSTAIEYMLAKECVVKISVFDVHGRRVTTLLAESQGPGRHGAVWNGLEEGGREASPGIYFYRLDADNQRTVRKMVLAR
jgi:hypothetical protein